MVFFTSTIGDKVENKERIASVEGRTVRTENGKEHNFPLNDPLLKHAKRGAYIEVEMINRGTDLFTIYTSRRQKVAEGKRTPLSEIS